VGKVTSFFEKRGKKFGSRGRFAYGAFVTIAVIGIFTIPALLLLNFLNEHAAFLYVVIGGFMLKPAFCLREQQRVAKRVIDFLSCKENHEEPPELRTLLSLVDKNKNDLSEPPIISASVRSLIENLVDFFVTPLFYFLIFSVPGAIAARIINTLDSMLGRRGDYEYFGKFAARLDDVMNYIPARITTLLIILAAYLSRMNSRLAWRTALHDHTNTASPNAGWTMAAAAGALEVQLVKAGHYKLGKAIKPLGVDTIGDAITLFEVTAVIWSFICLGFTVSINIL